MVAGLVFVVDFGRMLQYRVTDPTKRRKVKRDLSKVPIKGIAGISLKQLDGVDETTPVSDLAPSESNNISFRNNTFAANSDQRQAAPHTTRMSVSNISENDGNSTMVVRLPPADSTRADSSVRHRTTRLADILAQGSSSGRTNLLPNCPLSYPLHYANHSQHHGDDDVLYCHQRFSFGANSGMPENLRCCCHFHSGRLSSLSNTCNQNCKCLTDFACNNRSVHPCHYHQTCSGQPHCSSRVAANCNPVANSAADQTADPAQVAEFYQIDSLSSSSSEDEYQEF